MEHLVDWLAVFVSVVCRYGVNRVLDPSAILHDGCWRIRKNGEMHLPRKVLLG